jgi:cystathionine beta-lyase/cystathionine gamma-synthase
MNNLVVRVLRLCSERRKERAEAAATVIRYLAAQPFLSKVNNVFYSSQERYEHDGHPLSKSII